MKKSKMEKDDIQKKEESNFSIFSCFCLLLLLYYCYI